MIPLDIGPLSFIENVKITGKHEPFCLQEHEGEAYHPSLDDPFFPANEQTWDHVVSGSVAPYDLYPQEALQILAEALAIPCKTDLQKEKIMLPIDERVVSTRRALVSVSLARIAT